MGVALGKPAEYGQLVVQRRARITRALVSMDGKRVLDFGCGNGAQTNEFASDGANIVGVDLGMRDLETFADHLHATNTSSILPVCYDGGILPVVTGSVDLIITYDVLEHVQDEEQALTEMLRVLTPGGEIILAVPNKGWVFETHGAYLPLLPWNRVPFFSWLPDRIHSRYAKARIYRKRDIVSLMESHGFQTLTTRYVTAPMDMLKPASLRRLARRTVFASDTTNLSILATNVLVHARKPE